MHDMVCKKCGMTFDSRAVYGYACPHGSNCGPIEPRTELWLDPMPRVDVSLPPPVGYVTREEYDRLREALQDEAAGAARLRDELAEARREQDDWRDDPATSDAWNAGCNFAMDALCKVLRVDPDAVSWDAATETLEGDVMSVVCNILTAGLGEDWLAPGSRAEAAARTAREAAIREAAEVVRPKRQRPCDCEGCYCGDVGSAENVGGWEAEIWASNTILALLDSPPAGRNESKG